MAPRDGEAIARLAACCPETAYISVHEHFDVDPYDVFRAESEAMDAVVALAPGSRRIIGCGLVTYGPRTHDGAIVGGALIHDIKVHPAHRGMGVGSALVRWCRERARARVGRDGLILAYVQRGNRGSLGAFARAGIHAGPRFCVGMVAMRRQPPPPLPYEVRPAAREELDLITAGLTRFYEAHDLHTPQTADSLARWLQRTPVAAPVHEYWVAVDRAGAIVAGMGLTWRGRVARLRFAPLPAPARAVNLVTRLVPPDRTVRVLAGDKLWFRPGAVQAARHLWERLRWLGRDRADALRVSFDPRSPIAGLVGLPWWMPRATIYACASRAPRGQRPICP